MIQKYKGFITEKKKIEVKLLLESSLFATSNFMDRLKYLSKEKGMVGTIAGEIYDFIDSDEWIDEDKIKQNFFDTTEKEDMVSFLMQSKLPKDWDEERDPSLPYNTRGRGDVKVSKVIKYIINIIDEEGYWNVDIPKDKDIEAFVNAYKATKESTNFKFKLLKGDEIAKYYNQKKYYTETGSLGGSCMADESKGTFKIYSENETKVKLLVLIDEELDKISGRAIVWKLKDSPCEAKYLMDRVYTNRDSDFYKFKQYAEENGYLYKQRMNSHIDGNVEFMYKGTEIKGRVSVKLDGDFKSYPFIDTVCFLNKEKKELSNVPYIDGFFLHSVSGECDVCDSCNGKVVYCDIDQCRFNESEIDCDTCDGSGDSDSGKCVSCKGSGFVKCKHEEVTLCSDCGEGLEKLSVGSLRNSFSAKEFMAKYKNLIK